MQTTLKELGEVSPAHAGIDPLWGREYPRGRRFPRTRGDRPGLIDQETPLVLFPPHTRGSTPKTAECQDHSSVSPAHAGIDLGAADESPAEQSFPRTRGDRPDDEREQLDDLWFPPHTRGSTLRWEKIPLSRHVSPAHAGIDPGFPTQKRPRRRFPRTRGDRPNPPHFFDVIIMFPPHTRGSTSAGRMRPCNRQVSPAHAGIDLGIAVRRRHPVRFPRTRGDRLK